MCRGDDVDAVDVIFHFAHPRYGVAFIVAYIGVQLILSTFRYVPEWSTCVVSGLATWILGVGGFMERLGVGA